MDLILALNSHTSPCLKLSPFLGYSTWGLHVQIDWLISVYQVAKEYVCCSEVQGSHASYCSVLLPESKLEHDAAGVCRTRMTSMDDVIQAALVPCHFSGFPAHVRAKLRLA